MSPKLGQWPLTVAILPEQAPVLTCFGGLILAALLRRKKIRVVLCLAALPLGAQTIGVSQDASIDSSATNYGSVPTINTGGPNQSRGLVQFDLSALPAGTTGSNVTKATLVLFVNRVASAGTVNIDLANGPWTNKGSATRTVTTYIICWR